MSRVETAVRKVTLDWILACNNRQLDDLVSTYAPDALVLRPNHPAVRGAAAIREFFFAALDSGLGEVELDPLRVDIVGDVAYEAGRCKMLVPIVVGKRREERGKYLTVLARQPNGEWRIVSDCWSSDLSLMSSADSDLSKPAAVPPPTAKPVPARKTS
jgi:ketosteroid isomerase-like protein